MSNDLPEISSRQEKGFWNKPISRTEFILKSVITGTFVALISSVMDTAGAAEPDPSGAASIITLVMLIIFFALALYQCALCARRVRMYEANPWLCLLMFVPIVSLFFWFWLVFGREKKPWPKDQE